MYASCLMDNGDTRLSKRNAEIAISKNSHKNLIDKIDKPLKKWIDKKKFLTCPSISRASKEMDLDEKSLKDYLKYVVNATFDEWRDLLRIKESENYILNTNDYARLFSPEKYGFETLADFNKAFIAIHGVYPNVWRNKKFSQYHFRTIAPPEDLLSRLNLVRKAIYDFENKKEYRKPMLNHRTVAQAMHVSENDLGLYCKIELQNRIEDHIERLRIDDAKNLMMAYPNISVKDIGREVGFISSRNFRLAFHRQTKMTIDAWKASMSFKDIVVIEDFSKGDGKIPFDLKAIADWKRNKGFCERNLTKKDLAAALNFSEHRFDQYLKQVPKVSFSKWISDLRIKEAQRLLISTPTSTVTQIAFKCGFSNKSSFCKIFKEYTGQTPYEWRTLTLMTDEVAQVDIKSTIVKTVSDAVRIKIEDWVSEKGFCFCPLSTPLIAASIGITEDQLIAYCLHCEKSQVSQWLTKLKIVEATYLLVHNPLLEIRVIAKQVGYRDIKVFRNHFKMVTGALPTEWRRQHKWWNEDCSVFSQRKDDRLDLDLSRLSQVEQSTTDVQEMLSVFFEDETSASSNTPIPNDGFIINALLQEILAKNIWKRDEFVSLCAENGLLPGYVIEQINDIAYEKVDDLLIEEIGENLYIELAYKDLLK